MFLCPVFNLLLSLLTSQLHEVPQTGCYFSPEATALRLSREGKGEELAKALQESKCSVNDFQTGLLESLRKPCGLTPAEHVLDFGTFSSKAKERKVVRLGL